MDVTVGIAISKPQNYTLKGWEEASPHTEKISVTIGLEPSGDGGYSGFHVTGMIKGFFGVLNFRIRDFIG